MFWKISWSSQENICTWVSFSIRLAWPTSTLQKRPQYRCGIFKSNNFVEYLGMTVSAFEHVSSPKIYWKTIFDKTSNETARKEIFCCQDRTILNLFTAQWLKCTGWNNGCLNGISTSENCRQKKKLVLKMHLFVILLETKNVWGWRAQLKSFIGTLDPTWNVEYISWAES